jgi:hypothetical protein
VQNPLASHGDSIWESVSAPGSLLMSRDWPFLHHIAAQSAILVINRLLHVIIGTRVRIFLSTPLSLVAVRCGQSKQLIRTIRLSAHSGESGGKSEIVGRDAREKRRVYGSEKDEGTG